MWSNGINELGKNWEINWFLPKMAPFAFFSHPYLANGFHDPGFFFNN
jgi:hypothetical protein